MEPTVKTCTGGGSHDFAVSSEDANYPGLAYINEDCSSCGVSRQHTLRWDGKYGYRGCGADECSGGGQHEWGNIDDFESSSDDIGNGFTRTYTCGCAKCDGRRSETYRHEAVDYYGPDGSALG